MIISRRNFIKTVAGILLCCLVAGQTVLADGTRTILETHTGEEKISVYVKGADTTAEGLSVQIATSEAARVQTQVLSELDIPMRTLVMVDNSLSISAENRDKIAELLQNLISDRWNKEELGIAVFGENMTILTDYTSDYAALKKAIDGVDYQDQETYLTDVLCDWVTGSYKQNTEDIYHRIVIISDGVDNKSLGYTKDELYALLKEISIPIYAIGCVNGKNNEELENMFALSRMTGVDYILLDETEDVLDISAILNQDRDITKFVITPTEELMDGSKKTVKITLPDASVLTAEIVMPQKIYTAEEAQPAVMEPAEPQPDEPAPTVEVTFASAESKPETDRTLFVFGGLLLLILIVAVLIVLLILHKKKNRTQEFEQIDERLLRELENNTADQEGKTEVLKSFPERNLDDGSTVMIWNQNTTYQVVLTDVHSPAKSFQVPLYQSITVGRKKEQCDIALDYEKAVSGKHCEIFVRDGKFYIKDLQSANGTYVNNSKVLTETEIFSGNILKLGRLEVRFEVR